MADDVKITATVELNASNAAAEGQKIGRDLSKGIESGVKQIDVSKLINVDALAQKLSESLKSAVKGLNLSDELSKAFANIDLSKSGFGDSLKKTVGDAVKGVAPSGGAPPASHVPPSSSSSSGQDPIATFAQRLQPILSSLEAVSMVLRGAPVTSSLQMVGQAVRDFGVARAAAGMGGGIPPGGGGGPPSGPPSGGRAMVPYEGGGGAGGAAAAGGIASLFSAGNVANLLKGGLVAGGIGLAVKEVAKYVAELGEANAKENTTIRTMAGVLQMPLPGFLKLREEFKQGGLNIENYQRQFSRMAVTARREMPEVELKVKRAGDVAEEAAIKVREADRSVAKARDDRLLSTDKVVHAEGELAKFEAIGAQLREQQTRGAALGVGGAQVGLAGAKLQQAAAGVGQEFAPQEAALANIAGPLTVKGAKLGVAGARLAAEQARYQAFVARGGKDPDWAQRLAIEAADHGEKIAAHNIEQAKLHEQQAKTAEEKRVATDAAGAGPVAQANQAAYAAAQATAQARLHLDQARTNQVGTAIGQAYDPLEAEQRRKEVGVREAKRDREATADRLRLSEDAARTARDEQEKAPYQDIEFLQRGIKGVTAGRAPEGFDINKALAQPQAFAQAFGREGDYKGGAIITKFREFLRGAEAAGVSDVDQKSAALALFPGNRSFAGKEGDDFLKVMRSFRQLTPDKLQELEHEAAKIGSPESKAADQKIFDEKNAAAAREVDRQRETEEAARRFHGKATNTVEFFDAASQKAQRAVLGGLGVAEDVAGTVGDIHQKYIAPPELQAPANRVLDKFISSYDKATSSFGTAIGTTTAPATQEAAAPPHSEPGSHLEEAGSKISAASNAVPSALGEAASAIQQKAAEISNIQITAPKSQGTVEGEAKGGASATELAGGGQVSGHGSQTSDNIPIMASNNEYMMQDAAVQKYGVPFMDAVNHGKLNFAGGGLINLATGGDINYDRDEELRAALSAIQSGDIFLPGRAPSNNPYLKSFQRLFGLQPSMKSLDVTGSFSGKAKLDEFGSSGSLGASASGLPDGALGKIPLPRSRPAEAGTGNLGDRDIRVPAHLRNAVNAFAKANATRSLIENGKQVYELSPENVEKARRLALGLGKDIANPFVAQSAGEVADEQTRRRAYYASPGNTDLLSGVRVVRNEGTSNYNVYNDKALARFGIAGRGMHEQTPAERADWEAKDAQGIRGAPRIPYADLEDWAAKVGTPRAEPHIQTPEEDAKWRENEAMGIRGAPRVSTSSDPNSSYFYDEMTGALNRNKRPDDEDQLAAGGYIGNLMRGFAGGGLIGGSFGGAVASVPGYAGGGAIVQSSSGPSALSAHQLDLRTDAGDFSARIDDDTLQGINNSSLSRKLTQTGVAPTWWS